MDTPVDAAPLAMSSVKLPPFDAIYSELWFIQHDTQFGIKIIKVDKIEYYFVAASLGLSCSEVNQVHTNNPSCS